MNINLYNNPVNFGAIRVSTNLPAKPVKKQMMLVGTFGGNITRAV